MRTPSYLLAVRGALVAFEGGCGEAFSRRAFEAYWGENRDISQDAELSSLAREVGLEDRLFTERIASEEIKGRLRANTEELIARGGFGSPTMYVNDKDMYFGNDRLEISAAAPLPV